MKSHFRFRWTLSHTAITTVVICLLAIATVVTAPITGTLIVIGGAWFGSIDTVTFGSILLGIGGLAWWAIASKRSRQRLLTSG